MHVLISGPIELSSLQSYLYSSKVNSFHYSGLGGSQVNQIVRALLDENIKVTILTLDKSIPLGCIDIKYGPNLVIYCARWRRGRHVSLDCQQYERKIIKYMINLVPNVDIYHSHWSYEFSLPFLNFKTPHVVSVRDWHPLILKNTPSFYRVVRYIMASFTLKNAQYLLSNSPFIQSKILQKYGRDSTMIPNGISNSFYSLESTPKELKKTIWLISIPGHFSYAKNTKTLVEALFYLYSDYPHLDIRLSLVGVDFADFGPCYNWILQNFPPKFLSIFLFHGALKHFQIPALLQKSSIFINPSLHESFSNVLLEAMASSLPVIAGSKSGAPQWLLGGGKYGILCDVKSKLSLAKAVLSLLDPEVYSQYSSSAFDRSKDFSFSSINSQYIHFYNKILDASTSD